MENSATATKNRHLDRLEAKIRALFESKEEIAYVPSFRPDWYLGDWWEGYCDATGLDEKTKQAGYDLIDESF